MVDPEHVLGLLKIDNPADAAIRAIEIITRDTGALPNLVVVNGRVLLSIRPDLEGQIDPNEAYQITGDGQLTRVEREHGIDV